MIKSPTIVPCWSTFEAQNLGEENRGNAPSLSLFFALSLLIQKKSLTEEENKTAAERGDAQLLGTSFTSFYTINLQEKMKNRLRLSLLRVAQQKRRLKAYTCVLSAPGDKGSSRGDGQSSSVSRRRLQPGLAAESTGEPGWYPPVKGLTQGSLCGFPSPPPLFYKCQNISLIYFIIYSLKV